MDHLSQLQLVCLVSEGKVRNRIKESEVVDNYSHLLPLMHADRQRAVLNSFLHLSMHRAKGQLQQLACLDEDKWDILEVDQQDVDKVNSCKQRQHNHLQVDTGPFGQAHLDASFEVDHVELSFEHKIEEFEVVFRECDFPPKLVRFIFLTDNEIAIEFLQLLTKCVNSYEGNAYLLMRYKIVEFLIDKISEIKQDQPLLKHTSELLFTLLARGAFLGEKEEEFINYFKLEETRELFIEGAIYAMSQNTFSICYEFPLSPSSFLLSSFMSESDAHDQIKSKIYEMCRFPKFPSYKAGYSLSCWMKLKRIYESMLMFTFVDEENQSLIEIWFLSKRIYKPFNKVEEYIKSCRNYSDTDEESKDYDKDKFDNSNLLEILTSYTIESSFMIKFMDSKPQKFLCPQTIKIEVNKPFHLVFSHNRYNFSVSLNNTQILSSQSPYLKSPPSRLCTQAIDRSLCQTHLFSP